MSAVEPAATAFERAVGYRQVTDAHLLTLARQHGGQVATFDRGMMELMDDLAGEVELIP